MKKKENKAMKKNKALAVVIVTALFLGLLTFTAAVGFGPTGTGSAKNINTGLDLAGGVSITYQAVGDETPTQEQMNDTVYKLQQRVDSYSTEAQVYQEGSDRINIEIPGVSRCQRNPRRVGITRFPGVPADRWNRCSGWF